MIMSLHVSRDSRDRGDHACSFLASYTSLGVLVDEGTWRPINRASTANILVAISWKQYMGDEAGILIA